MKLNKYEKKICLFQSMLAYIVYVGTYAGIEILETGIFTAGIADMLTAFVLLGCFYLIFKDKQEKFYLE